MGRPQISAEGTRERWQRWLQTLSFFAMVVVLAVVLFLAGIVQHNERARQQATAAVRTQTVVRRTQALQFLPTPFGCGTLSEKQCAFAWFDTLGYPDLRGLPYVEVATGEEGWSSGPPENTYIRAFLLEDQGLTFTVLTTELLTITYTKTMTGTEEGERVGYEVQDLESAVATYMEELTRLQNSPEGEVVDYLWDRQLDVHAELLVLARACAANGLNDLADRVYDFAAALPNLYTGQVDPRPFRQAVAGEIASVTNRRNVLAFGDRAISRQELLGRFERFAVNFPESWFMTETVDTVILLQQMIEEDEAHIRQEKTFAEMTQVEQIAEFIFHLRDENRRYWSEPSSDSISYDPHGVSSPAYQLIQIGYPAVPQLIEALQDTRFTRSTDSGSVSGFDFYQVLRVDDVALMILEQIAGRRFAARQYAGMTEDEARAALQTEVEVWWQAIQEKGEEQVLIEGVEAGDWNSPFQASRLVEKYPDAALAAITTGLGHAKDGDIHSNLVYIAASLEGDTPVPLLLSLVASAPYLSSRLAAACELHARGRPEGLAAMIREWQSPGPGNPGDGSPSFVNEDLIEFLSFHGGLEAVQVLGTNLSSRSIEDRRTVMDILSRASFCSFSSTESYRGEDCRGEPDLPPQVAIAIEGVFVQALDDTGIAWARIEWGDIATSNARICDLAGHALATRWPERYKFDAGASQVERDRQLAVIRAAWRAAHPQP